ncbi:MAG: hypothetical protein B7Z55_17540, partial [Planctomycetales bacterium 12-60-4]
VARAMALGVLNMTPEASISAAITGDLGPNNDQEVDGLIWLAIAHRSAVDSSSLSVIHTQREVLPGAVESGAGTRRFRQALAAQRLLEVANHWLNQS